MAYEQAHGRCAVRVRQRVYAGNHELAYLPDVGVEVVDALVAARVHRQTERRRQAPVPRNEEVVVRFTARLPHVQEAALTVGRDVVHRVVGAELVLIPVTPRTSGHTDPVVHLVGDRCVAEPTVTRVVRLLDVRHPVRAGVIAVVPAVGKRRVGPQVGRACRRALQDLLGQRISWIAIQGLLQQARIDLPAEPDETLHRIDFFVRLGRLILHAVPDVVD